MSLSSIVTEVEKVAPSIAEVLNMPIIGSIVLSIIAKSLGVPEAELASLLATVATDPLVQQALALIESELAKIKE